jgi:hypothetical protein
MRLWPSVDAFSMKNTTRRPTKNTLFVIQDTTIGFGAYHHLQHATDKRTLKKKVEAYFILFSRLNYIFIRARAKSMYNQSARQVILQSTGLECSQELGLFLERLEGSMLDE